VRNKVNSKIMTGNKIENGEELIFETILGSAKKKFDFDTFQSGFHEIGSNLAENILAKTLKGFASGQKPEIISAELFNEVLMLGIEWDKGEIAKFVADKEKTLSLEIYASKLAMSMLREGIKPISIVNSLNQML
jgi:hypothetical protein